MMTSVVQRSVSQPRSLPTSLNEALRSLNYALGVLTACYPTCSAHCEQLHFPRAYTESEMASVVDAILSADGFIRSYLSNK